MGTEPLSEAAQAGRLGGGYLRPAVSNGHPKEQALIRRWWTEVHGARGRIVWEYYLGACYADAVWFPEAEESHAEYSGVGATMRFPLPGAPIVICEAKLRLTPELIGQATVYRFLAKAAGANVRSVIVFAEESSATFQAAAEDAGFQVVIQPTV
jgi:hypothetical protein